MNNKRVIRNLSWIVIGKIVQSLLALIIGGLTARFLGTSDFGLINYAVTIVNMIIPIAQVGQTAVIVQEIVNNPDKENEIIGSATLVSLVSSGICFFITLVLVSIVNSNEPETLLCCAIYGISIFFQATQLITYWFQAKLLSKYISIISLIAYILTAAYKAFLLVIKADIYMFALSYSIDFCIITVFSFVIYFKLTHKKLSFSIKYSKVLINKGKHFIIPGMLMTLLSQTDRIMLKNIVDNSASGIYAAASTCAGLSSFVFIAIIDTMRPVILEMKKNSEESFNKGITQLYSVIIYLGLLVGIITVAFSSIFIEIIYGDDYLAAVPVLMIVVWHTMFSFVGAVRDIWILGNNKQSILGPINMIGAILNVGLNFLFINIWGACGAALASVISLGFVYFVLGFCIKDLRLCSKLMISALNPGNIKEIIKTVIRKGH